MSSCHWLSGPPPGNMGDLQHFSTDPPVGVAHRIWSLWPWLGLGRRWPCWDSRLGSSGGVELNWRPSLGIGHDVSIGPVVVEAGALDHLTVSPLTRKRVTLGGNVGSPPSSSLILNLTCFLGFSSTGEGALLCCTLLLDSQVFVCNFKSLIWRQSHLPGGLDLGGLGKGDEDCLWHSCEGLWCCLNLLLPLDQEHHFHDPDSPISESSLGHLVASLACGSAEGDQINKAEWPQECLLLLEGPVKPGAPCRPPLALICLIHVVATSCSCLAVDGKTCWEPTPTPLNKLVQPLGKWHHQWHLWGSSWKGAQGLPLQLPLSVIFGSVFDTLSSSWKPYCGADGLIRRVTTPASGWWPS